MTPDEAQRLARLSMGRILRIMSRPFEDGDTEQYDAAKRAFWSAIDALDKSKPPDTRPNFARSYHGIVMRGD